MRSAAQLTPCLRIHHIERIDCGIRNPHLCALAAASGGRISTVRLRALDVSNRRQATLTTDRFKQQPRHRLRLRRILLDDCFAFDPTAIVELPGRTCKVSPDHLTRRVQEVRIRALQRPLPCKTAIDLRADAFGPQHERRVSRNIHRISRGLCTGPRRKAQRSANEKQEATCPQT